MSNVKLVSNVNSRSNDGRIDPAKAVPNETLCQVLSFLGPRSIAITSAVSTEWRRIIHSDITLHEEIDLLSRSRLWRSSFQDLPVLVRLSCLARNRVFKISPDITWLFMPTYMECFSDSESTSVLLNALLLCREHLQDIHLVLKDPQVWDRDSRPAQVVSFLLLLVQGLKSFSQLKQVRIEAPIGMRFKVGGGGKGLEVDFVDNQVNCWEGGQEKISALLREVKDLAGGDSDITEFQPGDLLDSEVTQVMGCVSNLEDLSIHANHPGLAKFFSAAELPKLHRLSVLALDRSDVQIARSFLFKMLKTYDSRLTSLTFDVLNNTKFKPPSEKLVFIFPRLELLDFSEVDSIANWFSRFDYPKLNSFFQARTYYDLFKLKSPKLKEPLMKVQCEAKGDRFIVNSDGVHQAV